MVYAYDNTDGLVKIIKKGRRYCIYRLKEIQVINKDIGFFASYGHRDPSEKHKYVFEKQKVACFGYKPYDDKDVSNNPDMFYDDVERKQHHKISIKV